MSQDLFRKQLENLIEAAPLEEQIIEALAASDEPMACHQLFDIIPDCPDRETLSRTVHSMAKEGQIVLVAQVPAPPGYPRGSVAVYSLPGREFQPREEKKPVRAEPAPVKNPPCPRHSSLTIKEQVVEMVRGIPESLAISKEEIIRHLPHIKRSCLITFIPRMVGEGTLGAIGHTSQRRFFDIRTKGKESVKTEKSPLSPETTLEVPASSLPPVPHVMRQAQPATIEPGDHEPLFALYTNGRLRIESGNTTILCAAATVKKLALLLSIGEHVYQEI